MTKIVYRLKPGAPPESELMIRMSMSRTSRPRPREDDSGDLVYAGYEGARNLLEALQYDADGLREGMYDPAELFDGSQNETVTFELVDSAGTVWTTGQETITEEDL